MTLTVGTDAYETLANVRAYWDARDATASAAWIALSDAAAEQLIRKATDYVDRKWSYIGEKATAVQRLKWPRKYAEVEGFTLDEATIPWQVAEATSIIAELLRLGTFDADGIVTDDAAAISMQKVDVITVQYDTSKRLQGGDIPSNVHQLLRPLTLGRGGLVRA
ncbi:MAG TPA: DnaT-like ssDNA-binding protein [Acidimicrobiia bacterium]